MNKGQKIVFRNGGSIECLPAGETVRGHRAELPFIEWDIAKLPSDDVLNEILKPFMTSKRKDRE